MIPSPGFIPSWIPLNVIWKWLEVILGADAIALFACCSVWCESARAFSKELFRLAICWSEYWLLFTEGGAAAGRTTWGNSATP